jgi:squalene cyclase
MSQDANLIMQRTLEFGNWDEVRWLFEIYGSGHIRTFVRQYGEKWLSPVAFNYWRKLLQIRTWRRTAFSTPKGELWSH